MIVTKNKVVSIDYTLTDKNKNLLDSTSGQKPLGYLHGYGNIISGLEHALEGKNPGDSLAVTVPAAQAYGEHDDRLVFDMPREKFGDVDSLEEGMQFQVHTPEGMQIFTVSKVDGDTVTVDGNHPLAGLDLTFDVTVTAVRDATEEELSHGHVHHEHECCGSPDCSGCGGDDCGGYEHGGSDHQNCGCGR